MPNDNITIEEPFIISDKETLIKILTDNENTKREYAITDEVKNNLEEILEAANVSEINQSGTISHIDRKGRFNIKLHKVLYSILKTGFALILLNTGHTSPGMKDNLGALKGLKDLFTSMRKLTFDEWHVIEVIQSFAFKHARFTLVAPGPTLQEIESELEKRGMSQDNLKSLLDEMVKDKILDALTVDSITYYQAMYLSEVLHGK